MSKTTHQLVVEAEMAMRYGADAADTPDDALSEAQGPRVSAHQAAVDQEFDARYGRVSAAESDDGADATEADDDGDEEDVTPPPDNRIPRLFTAAGYAGKVSGFTEDIKKAIENAGVTPQAIVDGEPAYDLDTLEELNKDGNAPVAQAMRAGRHSW